MKSQARATRRIGRILAATALLGLAVSVSACGRTPAGPSGVFIDTSTSPPPRPPTLTVSGVVSGDGQPVVGATVVVEGRGIRTTTDATGRYSVEIDDLSPTSVWLTADHDQFMFQPCAVWAEQLRAGAGALTIDVALSARRGPSGVPSAAVAGRRTVSGTVYTETTSGKLPVANAVVAWDVSNDDFRAWTETDAAGRFMLCGLWVHSRLGIVAYQGLLGGALSVQPGTGDADIQVMLR